MKHLLLMIVMLCFLGLIPETTKANGSPLPPMPSQAAVNNVISQTSGIPYTPLGVPNVVLNQLSNFTGVFANVRHQIDVDKSISYIKTTRRLTETVMPLLNSGSAVLDPDITAPGSEPRPGKIIGALFQPSRGVMVIVAIFKLNTFGCSNCEPEKIRFYYNSTQYHEYSIIWGQFNGQPSLLDQGSLIAHKYSCVTVGIEQVCWEPYSYSAVREEPTPKDIAYDAYTDAKDRYDLQVDFAVDDAVPDIVGQHQRTQCRQQLTNATSFNFLSQCRPNLVFTSAKEFQTNQPIGIFVVTHQTNLRAYNNGTGQFMGNLPTGRYLVRNATPSINTPGAIGVLQLINIDSNNHYLIPSMVMEGFAQSSAITEPRAAIKDGFVWGRCFGY